MYSKLGFCPSQTQIFKLKGCVDEAFVAGVKSKIKNTQILPPDDAVLSDIIKYDTPIHLGIDRSKFFHYWIGCEGSHLRAAYTDGGELCGYSTVRKASSYYRMSALYADDEATASALLASLLTALPGGSRVDFVVPGNNLDATCRVLKTAGIEPEQYDHETRMFTKTDIPLPSPKVFCFLNTSNVLM